MSIVERMSSSQRFQNYYNGNSYSWDITNSVLYERLPLFWRVLYRRFHCTVSLQVNTPSLLCIHSKVVVLVHWCVWLSRSVYSAAITTTLTLDTTRTNTATQLPGHPEDECRGLYGLPAALWLPCLHSLQLWLPSDPGSALSSIIVLY